MTPSHMPKTRSLALTGLAVVLSATTVGLASTPASARGMTASATSTRCANEAGSREVRQIDTAHYRMVLAIGSPENMYTQAEVDAQGITMGELMLSGTMNSPMTMNMTRGKKQHVEVSICNLRTGKVLRGAKVRMSIAPRGGTYMPMSVAEMRGLDEPITMSHYGNNVKVPRSSYNVKVATAGEKAVFRVTA